jgi:hypothetical protein
MPKSIKQWAIDKEKRKKAIAKTNQKINFKQAAENCFHYSLLRFTYSQVFGEVLNVGILFIFPKEHKVLFQYPKSFKRISLLYENDFEKGIEKYCKEFEMVKIEDNSLFNDLELLISKCYLPFDFTSLQFDKPKMVLCEPTNELINNYFNNFFKHYL